MDCKECDFCHRGIEVSDVCGQLYDSKDCTAHLKCMQYSAGLIQYKHNLGFGGFKIEKVKGEIRRGGKLKCAACSKSATSKKTCRGATAGCAVGRCGKSFHFYCAATSPHHVTRRMEVMVKQKDASKKRKMVEYRVFCSEKHHEAYEKDKVKDHQYIRKVEEESGSDEEGSDSDMAPPEMYSQPTQLDFDTDSSDDFEQLEKTPKSKSLKRKPTSDSDNSSEEEARSGRKKLRTPLKKVRKKRTQKVSETSTDSGTSVDLHHSRKTSAKKKSLSEHQDGGDSYLPESRLSQSSLAHAIGTLTPVQDRKSHSKLLGEAVTKQKLSFLEQIKKEADDKAVDLSKRKGEVIAKLDARKDCLLCFVELAEVTTDLEQKLKKFATKMYHIPASSFFISKSPGFQLSGEHIVYLLKDLTLTLRNGDIEEFHRLILNLKEEDISKYNYIIDLNNSYPDDLAKELYHKLRESIRDNLQQATTNMERQVGWYCRVQHKQEQIRIALLALCDATDPSHDIRNAFKCQSQIFQWAATTEPIPGPGDFSIEDQNKEYSILKQWLSSMEGSYIDPQPRDSTFLGKQGGSITNRLLNHFKAATVFQQTTACIVFIRPLDSALVNFQGYFRKLLAQTLDKGHQSYSSIVLVCDLDEQFDLQPENVKTLVPVDVQVRILSAWDPQEKSVSCVLVKLDLEGVKSSPTVDSDSA